MSPRDRLIKLMKDIHPRFANIASGCLNKEISMATHDDLAQALQGLCKDVRQYKIPLTNNEWNEIRKLEVDIRTHVSDLRGQVG